MTNLVGRTFGRLVVIADGGRDKSHRMMFICRCECGNERRVDAYNLTSGHSSSCGCKRKHTLSRIKFKHGEGNAGKLSPEYATWLSMKNRCYNPLWKGYEYWGGRGITVCERWRNSFQDFLADMGRRPENATSIDRINNDGNYEPGNCRWANHTQQSRNRRCVLTKTKEKLSV